MKVGYSSPCVCVCLTAEEGKKNRLSLEIPPCLASSHSVITTTQNNGYFHEKIVKMYFICNLATGSLHYSELAIIWWSCSCSFTTGTLSLKAVAPARHDGEATGSGVGGQLQSVFPILLLPCCRKCNEPLLQSGDHSTFGQMIIFLSCRQFSKAEKLWRVHILLDTISDVLID